MATWTATFSDMKIYFLDLLDLCHCYGMQSMNLSIHSRLFIDVPVSMALSALSVTD